jgi:hypothetical protein
MRNAKKIGFSVLLLVIVLQGLFIYMRIHNFPFMIYDMYSRPEHKKAYSSHYLIIADSDTLNLVSLPILKEGTIINSLKMYVYHQQNGEATWEKALNSRQERLGKTFTNRSNQYLKHSDAAIEQYPFWLKNYIEKQVIHRQIQHLEVYQSTIETRFGLLHQETKIISIGE